MIPDVQFQYEPDECFLLPVLRVGIARCECCDEAAAFGLTIGWLWWAISFVWPFRGEAHS